LFGLRLCVHAPGFHAAFAVVHRCWAGCVRQTSTFPESRCFVATLGASPRNRRGLGNIGSRLPPYGLMIQYGTFRVFKVTGPEPKARGGRETSPARRPSRPFQILLSEAESATHAFEGAGEAAQPAQQEPLARKRRRRRSSSRGRGASRSLRRRARTSTKKVGASATRSPGRGPSRRPRSCHSGSPSARSVRRSTPPSTARRRSLTPELDLTYQSEGLPR